MNRARKIVACCLAGGMVLTSVPMMAEASALSGVSTILSNKVEIEDSSLFAGVSGVVADYLTSAAEVNIHSVEAVAAGKEDADKEEDVTEEQAAAEAAKVDAKDVPDYDGGGMVGTWDFEEYLRELNKKYWIDTGGIRYNTWGSYSSLGYFAEDDTFRYMVAAYTYEEKGLTFNLETGEELRLSDFFEEGEDYIKILSDTNYEQNVRYNYRVYDEGDYEEFRRNYASEDSWWANYYEEFREYDAGNLYQGINPDQEYYLSG